MNNSMGKGIGMRDIRDQRTKTGWPWSERFGPSPRTNSDQDRDNFSKLGPATIRS